jgi:hypothetical protein
MTKEKVENKSNIGRPKNAPKLALYDSLCESAERDRRAGHEQLCMCDSLRNDIYS